jgi:hypothetical protein
MLDFNPQSYSPDGTAVFASDAQLLVKFYKHPEIAGYASKEAGRDVFHDVVMISVINPGEKEKIDVLATEHHKHRFPKQWENYLKGIEAGTTGTPLDHLFPGEPSTVANLKAFNIFSVEQLAAISDAAMVNIPMGRSLSDRAKKHLNTSSSLIAENQAMRSELDELKAQMAALTQAQTVSVLIGEGGTGGAAGAPVKRGPGRPKNPPAEGTAA